MTLLEMKKKTLGLIEELNPQSELLTDDPDISTKINEFSLLKFHGGQHDQIQNSIIT